MISSTNYTYLLNINPPDKVESVLSAIMNLQVYITPTVTFNIWINGTPCNTASYTVSTTFSGAGQGMITFDCSNVITKAGVYSVTLRPTQANTGASTMWLDLTYTNQPNDYVGSVGNVSRVNNVDYVKSTGKGTMEVHGTEYYENDDATLFIQLKDSLGYPIESATCSLDIHSPNTATQIHPDLVKSSLMQRLGHGGLYYYDFVTPAISGLYMTDVECSYATDNTKYYSEDSAFAPIRTVISGTYVGSPFILNSYLDWLYTQCDSATSGATKICDSVYNWTVGNNITQLFVNYMGESSGSPTTTIYYYNWLNSSWSVLPNTLTFHATASASVPSGVDEYLSNTIPNLTKAININDQVSIRTTTTAGSTFTLFTNLLQLEATKISTNIQDLKGSGEVHVSSVIPDSLSGRFYKINTCNGNIDGRCGFFTNDGEFDLNEGEIEDILNITSISTRPNIEIKYASGFAVDCSALYWIKMFNGTDWNDFTEYNTYSNANEENCLISLRLDIASGNIYEFWLKFDNYETWEVQYTKQIKESIMPSIQKLCENRNWNYTTPITETTPISSDVVTDLCHRSYDDFYWLDTFYNDSLPITTVGEYASYLQEMRFYRQELFNRYIFLSLNNQTSLMPEMTWKHNERTLTNLNVTGNVSIDFNQLSQNVWSYPNKNITTGQLWVGGTEYSTTETTGRIVARVLDSGANVVNGAICNLSIYYPTGVSLYKNDFMSIPVGQVNGIYYYDFNQSGQIGVHAYTIDCAKGGQRYFLMGTYHVFGNNITAIANEVWNNPVRNLTYSVPVNTTKIAEDVWGWEGSIADNILTKIAEKIWQFVGGVAEIIT